MKALIYKTAPKQTWPNRNELRGSTRLDDYSALFNPNKRRLFGRHAVPRMKKLRVRQGRLS